MQDNDRFIHSCTGCTFRRRSHSLRAALTFPLPMLTYFSTYEMNQLLCTMITPQFSHCVHHSKKSALSKRPPPKQLIPMICSWKTVSESMPPFLPGPSILCPTQLIRDLSSRGLQVFVTTCFDSEGKLWCRSGDTSTFYLIKRSTFYLIFSRHKVNSRRLESMAKAIQKKEKNY